ncbi:hypothetical protein BsWGS_26001 [Bradybaena similaris]
MDSHSRASQADLCSSPKRANAADSSSKEKKILQGRRQQRHSTEIGSEYHRWWVVRNAVGFETNEHIAGLLLDGFHGLLQHLVVMCGGEMYQSSKSADLKLPAESSDCYEDAAQSPSSSSSASPPGGIENMDEFIEYRNAISHYCDSLWRLCCQQGSQLQQLDKTSQPVQEFLIRLMGYLRSAKGRSYSLNPKKKRFKSSSICVRSLGERNHPQVSISKLCPPSAQHESQTAVGALNSEPHVTPSITRAGTDDHHEPVDGSAFCLQSEKAVVKQAVKSQEKASSKTVEDCAKPEKLAIENCFYEDQSISQYFPIQHESEKKELIKLQPKRSQLCYTRLQTVVSDESEVKETQLNHPVVEPSSSQQQKEKAAVPHPSHSSISEKQLLQESHPAQQFQKTDFQDGDLLQVTRASNTAYCPQKDSAVKVGKQFTQKSVNQDKNLGGSNEACNLTEKKKLGLCWNSDSLNSGMSLRRDASNTGSLKDCTFNMFRNVSDNAGACDKSDGEFGFLLTDALKILPCIDDDVGSQPSAQYPEKENYYIKKQGSQGGCKINASLPSVKLGHGYQGSSLMNSDQPVPVVSSSRVQQGHGYQASCLMTLPSDQPVPLVSTSRVQSLLANTQVPVQKVKETQTVGTCTNVYSEFRLNLNNQFVNEMKSHVLVGNASFQPLQPAVFSASEKSSSVSLGTPVLLYQTSMFPSTDSSLASLSSLVHNIVYNSYGTTIKPLALTSLTGPMPCSPPLLPALSVATLDSSSQKKSIAASLPVLSSQLNSSRPTILPFYISHTTDGSLPKSINPAGFSRSTAQPWTHIPAAATSAETPASFGNIDRMPPQVPTAAAHHSQPAAPGSSSADRHPTNIISSCAPSFQIKISGGKICSGTEFSNIYQVRKDTVPSPTLSSNMARVEEMDAKMKLDSSEQRLFNIPLINNQQHDLHTGLNSNLSTHHTVAASNLCDQTEQSVFACNPKEKPTFQLVGPEKAATIEVGNQEDSSVTPPGTILNSLLVNKDVARERNCIVSQSRNNGNDEASDVALKSDNVGESGASKTVDESVSLEVGSHHGYSRKSTSKKKRRVKDAACASNNKSPASMSSQKSSQRRQLLCPACGEVFFSCVDLLVHRLEQHGHVCGECDSRFLSFSRLKQHKDTDHPLMLICSQCQFHTFRRSDLLDHVWSAHGVSMIEADSNKDETHSCASVASSFLDASCDPADLTVAQEKLIDDSSMEVLEPAVDICSEQQGHDSSKQESLLVARESDSFYNQESLLTEKESNAAFYNRGQSENCHALAATKENKSTRNLSLSENEDAPDGLTASSGPVFPSFSREVSDTVRSDLATISAMFAQVSQHCQLGSADFLNASDNPASESEEPRLVIDTEVGSGHDAVRNGREQYKDRDAARNGREQYKDKDEAEDEKTGSVSLFRHARSNDKLCNRGFHKSKAGQSTSKARSIFLSHQEEESVNCVKKTVQSEFSDVCMKEGGEEKYLTTGKGTTRERLVMSISLKRQNAMPIFESHPHRKRKRHNSRSIVDSSTDAVVKGSDSGNSYSIKRLHSTNYTSCYDAPESSCDQISSSSDNLGKDGKHEVTLEDVPRMDSFLHCRENIKTNYQSPGCTAPPNNYLAKDVIDCPGNVHFKSNLLRDAINDVCNNSEHDLSLREQHFMTSLPPKKRKFKKFLRARDVSSTLENQTDFESVVSSVFTSQDTNLGNVQENSCIREDVHVSKQADMMDKIRHGVTEGNKEEVCCNIGRRENWITVPPMDVSTVESSPAYSGPQFAGPGQQCKTSGDSFVGSCKGQLLHRWSMKEHVGRRQGKRPEINCSVNGCEVKCLNKRDLRQHITIEHLGKTRKYMCSWPDCSKGFFARTHLSIHMLTHTGEKPVACDICDYRCRQRTALIWHLRKHGVFHKTVKVKSRRNSTTF